MEMVPKEKELLEWKKKREKEKGKKYNNGMFLCEVHFSNERESLNPNQTKNERSKYSTRNFKIFRKSGLF